MEALVLILMTMTMIPSSDAFSFGNFDLMHAITVACDTGH